tara:strand:+ start:4490 stop:4633 length:144 start_codon:yes stop_codon:yes gene_type:complete
MHGVFQRRSFPPQFAGALWLIPDTGFSQFQLYLGEALLAQIKVKDTP